jgi:lysophospholipase L1-like esterase
MMLKKTIFVLGAVAVALVFLYLRVNHQARKLPDNNPAAFLEEKQSTSGKKIVVCIGDSITHGRVSCDYVEELSRRLSPAGYVFINAGINGEFAYNVLRRIDQVIACNPDYVTILIGTNDANATLSDDNAESGVREMALPQKPDKGWYRQNLRGICSKLKANTRARIALLSLPPIGEDHASTPFLRAVQFSAVIREIAAAHKITYLPLNEQMAEYLERHGAAPALDYTNHQYVMYKDIFKHYVLGRSYNEIARANGFLLVTDFLHLNCTAAGMTADIIQDFLEGTLAP